MVSRRFDKLSAGLALSNKFLPVHCVVARDECPQRVLQDGFVIVPAQTKFYEIVSVVLRTMEADVGKIHQDERADGQILIKNWNPLPIPSVTENRSITVQEILGDLMNVAILHIQISKSSKQSEQKRSIEFLKNLMPFIQDERDKKENFYQTMNEETEDEEETNHQQSSTLKPTTSPNCYSYTSSNSNTNDADNAPLNLSTKGSNPTSTVSPTVNKSLLSYPFASLLSLTNQQSMFDSSPSSVKDFSFNRRQRERTTFDPHEETPRLLQIFTDTKHPTRYQIASICESLNALPCRKGKKALEPYNIQYWFKNARAALKRKKRRFGQTELGVVQSFSSRNCSSNSTLNVEEDRNRTSSKCELDSSDEIDADEDDDLELDEKQKDSKKNYYFNYFQAFDICLNDQQRSKAAPSDESNDDDNVSSVSEQSPPTQISMNNFNSNKNFNLTTNSNDFNRSRRNRIFIDPTSEVPKLEQWFAIETHPDHVLIERICSELNQGEYRTKFPKLESKHIRLWFKNHRAKVKRICRIQTPNTQIEPTTVETNEKISNDLQ